MSFGKKVHCEVCRRIGSSLSMKLMKDGKFVCRKGRKNCKGWYVLQ